jgi:hypothetical protein
MGPAEMSSKQQINVMETLDNNSSNWLLWQSRMQFLFESKGLLVHIEGTAVEPVLNPALAALTQPSDKQQRKIDWIEEKLEKYHTNKGLARSQIIMAVSESMVLKLQASTTAKAMWDTLIAKMTKKPKMVLTTLQRQLRNIKCSEEDNLHDHLDKAQDMYARLTEMGALMDEEEFMI